MAAKQEEAVASVRRKKNMDLEELRGVYRTKYGNYQARIWEPRRQTMTYLGSFATAEEAARAHAAAAVRLHLHGAARDFRQRTAATDNAPLLDVSRVDKDSTADSFSGHDAGTPGRAKKNKAEAWSGAWTEFRGVNRKRSGRYGAQIRGRKGKARWLGTFSTAEEAARAYDAVAVKLHGEAAKTNFKVDAAQAVGLEKAAIDDDADAPLLNVSCVDKDATADSCSSQDAGAPGRAGKKKADLSDFRKLPPPDFFSDCVIPGAQLDDFWTGLPHPELQPVDELLRDMDFSDVDELLRDMDFSDVGA